LKQQEDAVLQHQFEKVETVEEFGGNFRDFDGEDDLDDHNNALEEINMKYAIRVNDTVHSTYQTDFVENTTVKESATNDKNQYHINYPEWDYKSKTYKPDYCAIYPENVTVSDTNYYKNTLTEYQSVLLGLRKMLTSVNNKLQQQRRQTDGNEFDLDAVTDLYVDAKSGQTPSERIYLSNRKKEKDLSIMLLLDLSLSSDGYSAGNKIIDVEKQVSILFGEILDEFGIDFAINGFHSNTRNNTSFVEIKGFDTNWQKAKHKVGSVHPKGYTRIGVALRHANSLLQKRNTQNKWVILISDGKPNDYDKYEGQYGIRDVKKALSELNQHQIHAYALAIEAQAKYYLPQMFGQNHYQILSNPTELLKSLVKLYEKIKHQL
jgi:nitric oxide reductase NorD protein